MNQYPCFCGKTREVFTRYPILSRDVQTCFESLKVFLFVFTSLSWGLTMKYFLLSLPSPDSGRAIVSCWQKNVQCTGERLGGQACPGKVWLDKLIGSTRSS